MIELKIDNRTIEARQGETVLQAALRSGIEIPHFCYHPCLSVAGNCRICLVKVAGMPKLLPACNLAVSADMVVETDAEEVRAARKAVLQFIALNHPGECGICDKAGECRLQDYQQRYGEPEPLFVAEQNPKPKFYELGERLLLDGERCVLCSRCVRFTREVSASHQLGIVERGNHARVECLQNKGFDDPYGDNVVGLCPVGALLSRDFLYKSRVWFLEPVPSACTGCSRCCSVDVWRRKNEWQLRSLGEQFNRSAYRITARNNPQINGPWICNKGFELHRTMAAKRALTPMVRGQKVSAEKALGEAARLLAQAKNPAALVSAQASNEDLAIFKATLGSRLKVYTAEPGRPAEGEVLEDALLIRAEKAPNVEGLRSAFGHRPFERGAGHDLVLVWAEEADQGQFGDARLIRLGAFATGQEAQAELFIPISTSFERSGSFSNCDGQLSRFEKVFDKPAPVLHAGDIFERLGS